MSPSNMRRSPLSAPMRGNCWRNSAAWMSRKRRCPSCTGPTARLAGFPVRVYRISFSGELSYEIAVPASHGRAFWDACLAAGAEFGVMPYGTEALHVLRAEKGFIMIGDETDGTVIPQDLGLGWAISKKKADYLGKRGQERTFLASPGPLAAGGAGDAGWLGHPRWRLCGGRGRQPERPAQCAGPRHLDLLLARRWGAASRWV